MQEKNQTSRAAFLTLGCKVNQIETAMLARQFAAAGYTIVDFSDAADVYIINTCAVTGVGERKSRQMIRRARRQNPSAIIAVTGCYAQLYPDEAAKFDGVAVVAGTAEKKNLLPLVEAVRQRQGSAAIKRIGDIQTVGIYAEWDDVPAVDDRADKYAPLKRTRAFMKIQDGCENFCTYCIIPFTRGPLRSRPLENISREARELAAAGYREIVLTGIHLGAYGRDLTGGLTLASAVKSVLAENFARVRLGSLESIELDDELIALFHTEKRLAPHLHLPLQAGSDEILRRMNRHYTVAEFKSLAARVRAALPNIALTTDIIVGFPGETEELFAKTLKNAAEIGFSRIHVFPYSPRPRTIAAELDGQIGEAEKKRRVRVLELVGAEAASSFRQSLIGTTADVLLETENADGSRTGLTGNYVRVYTDAPLPPGEIATLRLVREYRDGLWGEPVN